MLIPFLPGVFYRRAPLTSRNIADTPGDARREGGARRPPPVADQGSRASGSGYELARRLWRSQGQAQYVPRSVNEEGAPSPTRAPSIANGRRATQAYRCQGARRAPQQDAKEGGSGAGATSVQRLPASALWVLSRRNGKVPPPAGTSTGNFADILSVRKTDCHTSDTVTGSQ